MKGETRMRKIIAKAAGVGYAAIALAQNTFAAAPKSLIEGVLGTKPDNAPSCLFAVGECAGSQSVFQVVANVLIFLVGGVAVIMLIIGGLRYVLSTGDDKQVVGAKNTILYSIIGIVVAILAFAAVNFVVSQFQNVT
jgi:hypothetical protein